MLRAHVCSEWMVSLYFIMSLILEQKIRVQEGGLELG